MAEVDHTKKQVKPHSKANADNHDGKKGVSLNPPVFQLQAVAPKIIKDDKTAVPKDSLKASLKKIYDTSLTKNKDNKVLAFDDLAKYIADRTFARRTTDHKYIILPNSIKLSGDTAVMNYLHEIGYWKDKPRRLEKAAKGLYDDFSSEKDSSGNRTEGYGEGHADVKDKFKQIASVTRSEDADERKKDDKTLKDAKSTDRVSKSSVENTVKSFQGDTFAWSAMTISKIHHMAGSGDTFHYADAHVRYAKKAKENVGKDDISGLEKMHRAFDSPGLAKTTASKKKYELLAEKEKAKGNTSKVEEYQIKIDALKEKMKSQTATPVKKGDTLHRGRIKASTYEKIYKNTHSDVVVAIEVYKGEKGSLAKVGTYDDFLKKYAIESAKDSNLSLEAFAAKNKYKVYAAAIGGNTLDFKDPDTAIPRKGDGETLGKNYIPLNPDKTIKGKTGRNNSSYKSKEAYFGVQRTDYRD